MIRQVTFGFLISMISSCFTLQYIKNLYSSLSKSNFKDHYGDAAKEQYLGRIAEINVFQLLTKYLSL